MGIRTFRVEWSIEVLIELDDQVIEVVDDEWRSQLYDLKTPGQIAEHVAQNLVRGARLSMLDGWADQPEINAIIVYEDWELRESSEVEE